ncbi:MAG: ATP-dependent RNA helicase HrpA [Pseudomonadota bacterium]
MHNIKQQNLLINKIEFRIKKAMRADRPVLYRDIAKLKNAVSKNFAGQKIESLLSDITKKLDASIHEQTLRRNNIPKFDFDSDLPITAKKDEIIDSIVKNQVVIISGETGSGKTTQLPKFCLAAGRGIFGKIGCTQPRRIAAITVCARIAQELSEETGKSVGYKIRFDDKTHKDSYIKIMTDGILLAEANNDPYLNEYDTIIVDEAHERSLNIDFILGVLKTLLKKRKDLKLIITSATIDTDKFSKAFDNAPVIEVSGRMFPVDVRYLPVDFEPEKDEDKSHADLAIEAVDKIVKENPYGDILIFMPTELDIREATEILEGRKYRSVEIIPLFARLPASEQKKVFLPLSARKIIISTNIAETSITIPGIKYVIDTGLARIPHYTPRSRSTAMPVVSVSKSSADQRKGRCGRVENGICVRLYTKENYEARSLYTLPEILRSNLAEVVLRMIALKLGEVSSFPFIDRPSPKSIKDGYDILLELGAIKQEPGNKALYCLTPTGKLMASLPVDPRLSRMLIEAPNRGCLEEMTVIASAISSQDPRQRPADKTEEADRAHKVFSDPLSDFITLLNIWNKYNEASGTTSGARKFCKANFLSFRRMKEWRDIHTQITNILIETGMKSRKTESGKALSGANKSDSKFSPLYTAIHKSILSGFLSNIAMKKEKNNFCATRDKSVMIFPGSGLFKNPPTWIVSAEMVETSRFFARTAATIESAWIEEIGKEQCKYSHYGPHWDRKRGEVVAIEKASLYGLAIVAGRSVSYGKINPEEASDIFIRCALVEEDIDTFLPFMEHNKNIKEEVLDMENRLRKRDVFAGNETIFEFYKKQLPGICDIRTLSRHIKSFGNDKHLRMKKEDLLRYLPDEENLSLYPDSINLGKKPFICLYNFDPGKPDDGITVKIPVSSSSSVLPEKTDWVVPGLLQEKITALIKGLPKEYRKKLLPLSKIVDIIIEKMPRGKAALATELSNFIFRNFGIDIPASAWSYDSLPEHLKMRFSITDAKGKEIFAGKDKNILLKDFSKPLDNRMLASVKRKYEKAGILKWDFGDIAKQLVIKEDENTSRIYFPALEKDEGCVNLRIFESEKTAQLSHKQGSIALFLITFDKDIKHVKKQISIPTELHKFTVFFGGVKSFDKMLFNGIINDLFDKEIRTGDIFNTHSQYVLKNIFSYGQEKIKQISPVIEAFHETRSILQDLCKKCRLNNKEAFLMIDRLENEVVRLVPNNFIQLYEPKRLLHLPRYLKATSIRAQRAMIDPEKDNLKTRELETHTFSLDKLLKNISPFISEEKRKAMEEYFWLIEEYKVSLFAQELKTPIPISSKRLDKKLKEIERLI